MGFSVGSYSFRESCLGKGESLIRIRGGVGKEFRRGNRRGGVFVCMNFKVLI